MLSLALMLTLVVISVMSRGALLGYVLYMRRSVPAEDYAEDKLDTVLFKLMPRGSKRAIFPIKGHELPLLLHHYGQGGTVHALYVRIAKPAGAKRAAYPSVRLQFVSRMDANDPLMQEFLGRPLHLPDHYGLQAQVQRLVTRVLPTENVAKA